MATSRLKLLWSPEAERDLGDAYDYVAITGSPGGAANLLRSLEQGCRSLLDYPHKGRPRSELTSGLRSMVIHPYVVFYRLSETAVEVVRVLHGRRDIDAIFGAD
ncbi:MAG: type II toxin-antitoxin system RelE/ParE family toxin [Rhodoplanes sp.]|uniref:type II toxin-antitoxin system RelE/ParE family toxin n=1 Tax=Rhodoplanes sp. TaxID=1968906 RepID=UPI001842844F|nr:type II toxin-antitoxin system RelE/ParE family toxin [Rhodoplanes sp.]